MGNNSLIIPAVMIGTEQRIVTRMVSTTLVSKVKTARNLDIINFFQIVNCKMYASEAQGADSTRIYAVAFVERWSAFSMREYTSKPIPFSYIHIEQIITKMQ
jgi:hypothetical protein